MSRTKDALMKGLYTPWDLTPAERAFCGDLDELRRQFGVPDPIPPIPQEPPMTDDELDEMTARATDGTLDEAEYDSLTDAAVRNWEHLLADPEAMAKALSDVFVPAPGDEPEVCIDCGGKVNLEIMICEACYYRDNPEEANDDGEVQG